MSSPIVFELCVDTVEAALAAEQGGADRLELCSSLAEGGLTPGPGLLQRVMQQVTLPVHAMIRPRGGNFLCSDEDLAAMEHDILYAKSNGCAGVVFGILQADGCVDIARTRHLVALAAPMEVTFHRAFDEVRDLPKAFEDVIATGAGRLLTAGGCEEASEAASTIAELVKQAAGRIQIAIGGGVDTENVALLVHQTGASHVHASLRARMNSTADRHNEFSRSGGSIVVTTKAVRDFADVVQRVSAGC